MIHTFTLLAPIDLEWVDSEGNIIHSELAVPPRSIRSCRYAYGVRERYARAWLPNSPLDKSRIHQHFSKFWGGSRRKAPASPNQSGMGSVETIIALPAMLLIMFIALQLTYIGIAKLHLSHILREGMRVATAELVSPMNSRESSDAVIDVFEDAIRREFRAWAVFYGEDSAFTAKNKIIWSASLTTAVMNRSDLSSEAMDDPDHLSGRLNYWMPLKLPFFGKSLSSLMPSLGRCEIAEPRVLLCFESDRWYWRLQAMARSPLPPSSLENRIGEVNHSISNNINVLQTNPSRGEDLENSRGLDGAVEALVGRRGLINQAQKNAVVDPITDGLASSAAKPLTQSRVGEPPQSIAALLAEVDGRPVPAFDSTKASSGCGIQFGS